MNRIIRGRMKGSDAETIAFVKANPDAIGDVSTDAPVPDVKTAKVNP